MTPAVPRPLRVLDLYCGIGGCAAALAGRAITVGAVDVSRLALSVYAANFPDHPVRAATVESRTPAALARLEADLWWLSPPCQPFTRRGSRRDLDDPRASSLRPLLRLVEAVAPRYVALENVPGFETSRAGAEVLDRLERAGYAVASRLLCPTELGVPNRRRRLYLVASRDGLRPFAPPQQDGRPLDAYLDDEPEHGLTVDPGLLARYARAADVVDPRDPDAVAATFTAAYGRSPVRSGSYLRAPDGTVRRFSPGEVLRLLGFPASFRWPAGLTRRQAWRLAGNSLSVPAVREVLRQIPHPPPGPLLVAAP